MNNILQKSIKIIKQTGDFIRNEQQKVTSKIVETKNVNDFVTYVDKTAEKQLVAELEKLIPKAGFIAEEKTETRLGEVYNWIVDPLDGTTNYIHKLYPVAISVALQKNNETILGIVYELGLDECFYAIKDNGAFLNGNRISVSSATKVKDSLISTGFPYYNYDKLPQFMNSLSYFMKNSHGLRRLGSAATDLAYVACGRFEAFYEYSLNAWDVAAGALIVQEAGGKVCDFEGGVNYIFGREIIATNSNIFDQFLGILKRIMSEKL